MGFATREAPKGKGCIVKILVYCTVLQWGKPLNRFREQGDSRFVIHEESGDRMPWKSLSICLEGSSDLSSLSSS